jgi:hypothetical protein
LAKTEIVADEIFGNTKAERRFGLMWSGTCGATTACTISKCGAKQLKGASVVDLAELEVVGAIWEAAKYDRKDRLLAYLRSNRPLTAIDRQCLADYLEGKLNRKKGRPRGGGSALNVRNVAVMVDHYKAKLREAGKRYQIHKTAVI